MTSPRNMVFHAPYPIQEDPAVASALRPKKMRQAFADLGYNVIDVTGYASERQRNMKDLFRALDEGLEVDFVYSESATIPNSFTEPKHIPLHPFLDRNLFKEMRSRGIPVGVYYRDIYWVFPEYAKNVGPVVAAPMRLLYRWDVDAYSKYLTTLFVQSLDMLEHLTVRLDCDTAPLPPAADFADRPAVSLQPGEPLELFFVGGLNKDHYDLTLLLEVVNARDDVHLTLCVRENEWREIGPDYADVLGDNIDVVHRSASELGDLYSRAHVCLLYLPPGEYREFVLPVKLFEYLGNSRPILASRPTMASEFIESRGLGWARDYSHEELNRFLDHLLEHPEDLHQKSEAAREFGQENQWSDRAAQAAAELLASAAESELTAISSHNDAPSVAIVTPWYPNERNPVEGLFVSRDVQAIKDSGMDVRVIFLDRGLAAGETQAEMRGGVQVLHIGMNPANPASVAKAIPRLKKALEPIDIVHSHAISSLPAVAAAHENKPWVHTEHWSALSSPDTLPPHIRAVRPAFASMLKLPDRVIAVSDRGAEPIRKIRGSKPVELVPCIVGSPSRVTPTRWESGNMPQDDTIRLVSTGGVIERKNPELAVRTLEALRRRGRPASLRWIGVGDLTDSMRDLANELDVDAEFLGSRSPGEVEEELAFADVFIGPTRGDNFFVSVAEALVNGRPVCVGDRGGHVEYCDPAYSEIVVGEDPEDFAEAIIALVDKTREVSAQQIADSVSRRFAPETVARRFRGIYDELLGRDTGAAVR